MCLFKINALKKEDAKAVVIKIFNEYILSSIILLLFI